MRLVLLSRVKERLMHSLRFLVLVIPFVLIGSLACSSSDEDNSSTGTNTTSPTATTTLASNSTSVSPTVPVASNTQVVAQPTIVQGGAAAADACGLVTKDDAATGLGEAVRDGTAVS